MVTVTLDTSTWTVDRHTVYVRARDAGGHWGAVSAAFVDLRANDPPVIDVATPDTPLVMPTLVTDTFTVSAHDPDGDALDYTWSIDGVEGVHCGEPSFSYAPDDGDAGVHRLTVSASDGRSSATHTWEIVAFDNVGIEIIDNVDANTSRTGTWRVSSGVDPYGTNSLYSNSDGVFGWQKAF